MAFPGRSFRWVGVGGVVRVVGRLFPGVSRLACRPGNDFGQLGDGTTTDRYTPVQVQGLSGVVAVAAGSDHSLALKSDGTLWAWGYNGYGQLGDGTTTNRYSPVKVQLLQE